MSPKDRVKAMGDAPEKRYNKRTTRRKMAIYKTGHPWLKTDGADMGSFPKKDKVEVPEVSKRRR